MVKRIDLKPDPQQAMSRLVKRLNESSQQQTTVPTGVKDLGVQGDVVWREADGTIGGSVKSTMSQVQSDLDRLNGEILPSIKDGTYIGDEAITSRMIAANTIGADHLMANAITAGKIAATAFVGETFIGGTFKGTEFQTPADPAINGGIAIDPRRGLRGWDTSGNLTMQLTPAYGDIRISARMKAMNEDGVGVMLIPTTKLGGGGIWFSDDGTASSKAAALWRSQYDPNSAEPLYIRGANGGHVAVIGGLNVSGGGAVIEGALVVNDTLKVWSLAEFSDRSYFKNLPSQSGTVVVARSDGRLGTQSSSRRYKREIESWAPDPAEVLAMRPVTYLDAEDEESPVYPGFIAEEVAEHPSLAPLVRLGSEGEPDGLHYDRFAAAYHTVLCDMDRRLRDLEEKR